MKMLLLLMAVLLLSCGSNAVPSDIVPDDKMTTILWQMMMSDEYVNGLVARDSSKKSSTERMIRYQQIYDLNKVTAATFKKSYQFYMERPELAKAIFDSITVRANRQRNLLYQPVKDTAVKHLRKPR